MESAVMMGRWEKERGRELCAARAVRSGEILFGARPFVSALCFENLVSHCSRCFLPLEANTAHVPASRCGGCQLFTVCGACAALGHDHTIAFMEAHVESGECAILAQGEMTDTTSRLLLQLFQRRRPTPVSDTMAPVYVRRGPGITAEEAALAGDTEGGAEGLVALPTAMAGMESLDGHEDAESDTKQGESRLEYEEYVRCVLAFVGQGGAVRGGKDEPGCLNEADMRRVLRWLSILRYNQHSISCDLTGEMLGNMLVPEGSLFNHACEPNVALVFAGGGEDAGIRFTAIQEVAAGAPLCISYVPEFSPFAVRQETLRSHWLFVCSCCRCAGVAALREGGGQQGQEVATDLMLVRKEGCASVLKRGEAGGDDGGHGVGLRGGATSCEEWADLFPSLVGTHEVMVREEGEGRKDMGEQVLRSWGLRDLGEELQAFVHGQIAGGAEVTVSQVQAEIARLETQAEAARLSKSHWSLLRLLSGAGDILTALNAPGAAAQFQRRLLTQSAELVNLPVSIRLHVKLALSLRLSCAEHGELGGAEEGEGGLAMEAAQLLTRAEGDMTRFFGAGHWALKRVQQELSEARAEVLVRQCRRAPVALPDQGCGSVAGRVDQEGHSNEGGGNEGVKRPRLNRSRSHDT